MGIPGQTVGLGLGKRSVIGWFGVGEAYIDFNFGWRFFANIAQGSRLGGGGAAGNFQSYRSGLERRYLMTNMVLLFWKNKIRFSGVKIRTRVSCEATNCQVLFERKENVIVLIKIIWGSQEGLVH